MYAISSRRNVLSHKVSPPPQPDQSKQSKQRASRKANLKSLLWSSIALCFVCALASNSTFTYPLRRWIKSWPLVKSLQHDTSDQTVAGALPAARERLRHLFLDAGAAYPPASAILLVLKHERQMQVYAGSTSQQYHKVTSYKIQGASGTAGPKLQEGDFQVPEGFYKIQLEPHTPYHLGLRLNYPNQFDLQHAKIDGRTKPGGDILIHGSNCSIGCIAMGDPVSEDLYTLACDTGAENIEVVIVPLDFRNPPESVRLPTTPPWLPALYESLKERLALLD